MVRACVKKYTPAGLSNYLNSRVLGYGLLGELMLFIDNLMVTHKRLKTSVSTVDGTLVGRRERIHGGVLLW